MTTRYLDYDGLTTLVSLMQSDAQGRADTALADAKDYFDNASGFYTYELTNDGLTLTFTENAPDETSTVSVLDLGTAVEAYGYVTSSQLTSALASYASADDIKTYALALSSQVLVFTETSGDTSSSVSIDLSPLVSGYATSDEVEEAIAAAVSSAYEVKGSCAFADLPESADVGDVYNITDAFTTTASFVEGAGAEYPAGTNVVYTSAGWDVLAGVIDLSGYVTSSELEAYGYIAESDISAITDTEIAACFA